MTNSQLEKESGLSSRVEPDRLARLDREAHIYSTRPEAESGRRKWARIEFLSKHNWSTIVAQNFGGAIRVDRKVMGSGTEIYGLAKPALKD